ncbi:MAG: gluconate 2-dehydrogenase subunit 3 family protein [Spirosomataceae bacterium]
MQRRVALKNLSMAVGGLMSLPTWASAWTPESIGQVGILSFAEEETLAEIVETIIPETNTPGAKSLKVHQFAMRMINDCYGNEAQKNLKQGLILADTACQQTYNKTFVASDKAQRTDILNKMVGSNNAPAKQFVNMIKNLTIQGYTNSEYYMVNVQKYVMAPGFYHGCVPIKKA